MPVGPLPGRLVQAQAAHCADAAGVVDEWPAVVAHGFHDRRPAHAQGAGDLGHGVVVPTHPPTGLGPGPLGQRRPRGDEGAGLAPGLDVAVGITAAPETLGPDHNHGTPATGQVTHLRPAPALRQRPGPTARTPDHGVLRLDELVQLAVDLDRGQEHESLQAQYRHRAVATLESHQGPPRFSVAFDSSKNHEAPGLSVDGQPLSTTGLKFTLPASSRAYGADPAQVVDASQLVRRTELEELADLGGKG